LHATMTSGPVQLATHSISVRGRQSRGNQEAIKRQSEVISDPLDLGASRRREQRVQVRQLLTQQHLWGSRRAVVSACLQGRACKTGALTRQHLGRSHQRHSRGHQRSSARSHLGRSHQRHSRSSQRSSARSHLEVLIKGTQVAIRAPQRDRTSRFSSLRLPPASRLAPDEAAAAAELEVASADETELEVGRVDETALEVGRVDETAAPDAPVAGAAAACADAASRCRAACALSQSRVGAAEVGAAAATAVSGREDAAEGTAEDTAVNPEDAVEGGAATDGEEKDGAGGGVASAAPSARVGAAPSSVDGESLCEVRRRAGEPACGPKKTEGRDVRASVAAGVGYAGGGSDGSTGSTGARASAGAGGGIDRGGERVGARGGSGAGS
jgi:hypothetical protein